MDPQPQLQDITHTIQLAVAPVFLLTAFATTLSVFGLRLARIVDRGRVVEANLPVAPPGQLESIRLELAVLSARARLIHLALTFGISAAILVCLVIAVAFVGYLVGAHVGVVLALLFILAVIAYVVALLCYLREVFKAIGKLRFGLQHEVHGGPPPTAP